MSEYSSNKPFKKHTGLLIGLIVCALFLAYRLIFIFFSDSSRFPINTIKITAVYKQIERKDLEKILINYNQQSFFSLSRKKLRQDLLAIPWAQEVTVEKIWPDTIKIQLIEKSPVAFWNKNFITEDGHIYDTKCQQSDFFLANLSGPDNQQLKVLQIYQKLSKLLTKQGLEVSSLKLNDNNTWELSLSNGIRLYLGQQDLEKRLERFLQAYSLLFHNKKVDSCHVDLRFQHGMTVRWNQ